MEILKELSYRIQDLDSGWEYQLGLVLVLDDNHYEVHEFVYQVGEDVAIPVLLKKEEHVAGKRYLEAILKSRQLVFDFMNRYSLDELLRGQIP